MTMYMWQPEKNQWDLALSILQGTCRQLQDVFALSVQEAWSRIGCCPMYGDNGGHGDWTTDNRQSLWFRRAA